SKMSMRCGSSGLAAEIGLDRSQYLDGHRIAVTVLGIAGRHSHPALADAVLLDVVALHTLEADADVSREHLGVVIRARRIGGEAVGRGISHRINPDFEFGTRAYQPDALGRSPKSALSFSYKRQRPRRARAFLEFEPSGFSL